MTDRSSYFVPCARGLEPLLADELRRLRLHGVRPQRAGVLFSGTTIDSYKVLLWSRLASRILLPLGQVDATTADTLYEGIRALEWEDHMRANGSLAVDAVGMNDALRNTQFTAVKCKDAIVDRFREKFGRRPSVDTRTPDLRINVAVRENKATISLDLAGVAMHRRGYREPGVQVAAPMKETLAAAVLEVAGWREIAAAGGAFLDPMCGSGTLAIEAALMAADIAPGLLAPEHAVERWLGHDAGAWQRLVDDAQARKAAGLAKLVAIAGSDSDERAVQVASSCARRAGLERYLVFSRRNVSAATRPAGALDVPGLVACNPPYGERIGERAALPALYAGLATALRERFDGWTLAVITPDTELSKGLGMKATRTHELFNGRISSPVSVFTVDAASTSAIPAAAASTASGTRPAAPRLATPGGSGVHPAFDAASVPVPSPESTDFGNRLAKMSAHVGKWARRAGVGCYRVYDADLPDYNVAIDVYHGAAEDEGRRWVHIAEYAAPVGIDAARAEARLADAVAHCALRFEVPVESVFVKRRERQRGSAQYERVSRESVTGTVSENGLLFEVNMSDYLDTGIFLDHRDTRAWLRDLAPQTHFLNLFAYTGTASVYGAAGGAISTTTVDLSSTYLDWAKRNLERNGFSGERHTVVRADVLEWLEKARTRPERYDLIFCDPPTFSNSKRMDATFDVQRDHVPLVFAIARVLDEDGVLVFSCNRKKFEFDAAALSAAGLEVKDVTKSTIPKDFERNPSVHSCWTVRRGLRS